MRIGILGGGQLAMMMVEENQKKHGIDFIVVDPSINPPASRFAQHIQADYNDRNVLEKLSKECNLVTIDFENVPADSLIYLEKYINVFPNPKALETCQDRLFEKNLFSKLDISTTKYKNISNENELKDALEEFGSNSIIKSRRFGYDGKNQIVVSNLSAEDIWKKSGKNLSIIENKIKFKKELSLIGVRTNSKKIFFYPLVENNHKDGILNTSIAPYEDELKQKEAENILSKIMKELNYIGVLVIEFFLDENNNLIANEMAPRVHNSGHWTIEGANISQFEAHIRAISGLDIESIYAKGYSAMINLISKMPKKEKFNSDTDIHFYDYGKEERNKRKLGHVTINQSNLNSLNQKLEYLKNKIS